VRHERALWWSGGAARVDEDGGIARRRVDRREARRAAREQRLPGGDAFAARTISGADFGGTSPSVPFAEPLVVEDVHRLPLIAGQVDAYRTEGICSMLVFPLAIRGRRSATLVLYYRRPRQFSEVELQTGLALGNLAATAITVAELYEQQEGYRRSAERAQQRAAFLAEAGATLSASLDYEKTLAAVAALAVPHIADWCGVDVVDGDGRVPVDEVGAEAPVERRDREDGREIPGPAHRHRVPRESLARSATQERAPARGRKMRFVASRALPPHELEHLAFPAAPGALGGGSSARAGNGT
jgi:GAF domain-containing protein